MARAAAETGMDFEGAYGLSKVCVANRMPFLLVGSPGIGKTQLVKKISRELKTRCRILHPAVEEPVDYKGMPTVLRSGEKAEAHFLPFTNFREMLTAEEPLLVFFDDLGQATPATQAAVMQVILARELDGQKISDFVTFGAATNRPADKAGVQRFITPLLDRFPAVIHMRASFDTWNKWYQGEQYTPMIPAFLRWRPAHFNSFAANDQSLQKWGSPRAYEDLARLLAVDGFSHSVDNIGAVVGEGIASEFVAFLRSWGKIPEPEEVFKNPKKVKMPQEADVMYALMGALSAAVDTGTFSKLMDFLNREDCAVEYAVLCLKDATERNKKLIKEPSLTEFVREHRECFA